MRNTLLSSLLVTSALVLHAAPGLAAGGTGTFNYPINWRYTGDLTYTISGAPPNTCGDLLASRNGGAYTRTAGWVCTDGSGAATKGPWSWDNQNGDETAFAYIEWPDSSTTNTAKHIWDKTCATDVITSGGGSPPTSFSGTATDGAWGAGFDSSWTSCVAIFKDTTTGKYWTPAAGAYSATDQDAVREVQCTVSGMPSLAVTWSASQIPPPSAHTTNDYYQWSVVVDDGSCAQGSALTFRR
jgi:hypothetical protein